MSHYVLWGIGENYDESMKKYDENIEVPHTISKEELVAKTRKYIKEYEYGYIWQEWLKDPIKYIADRKLSKTDGHIVYLKEEFPKKLKWTDEECYQDEIRWYEEEKINEDGSVNSTYNPNSKWDWYKIGGRWSGLLIMKEGREPEIHSSEDNSKYDFMVGTSAFKQDIDFEKMKEQNWFYGFAFLTEDGEWVEKGSIGWFGMSDDKFTDEEWNKKFQEYIESLSDDTLITIIDCHI